MDGEREDGEKDGDGTVMRTERWRENDGKRNGGKKVAGNTAAGEGRRDWQEKETEWKRENQLLQHIETGERKGALLLFVAIFGGQFKHGHIE